MGVPDYLLVCLLQEKGEAANSSLSSTVEYYSAGRIKHTARVFLALVSAIFAIIPVPILFCVRSMGIRISIIAAFAVVFAAIFSVMTNSRTPEMFATMAA
jgi:predicted neutral ceramidase superfamily lipid hydrolase